MRRRENETLPGLMLKKCVVTVIAGLFLLFFFFLAKPAKLMVLASDFIAVLKYIQMQS